MHVYQPLTRRTARKCGRESSVDSDRSTSKKVKLKSDEEFVKVEKDTRLKAKKRRITINGKFYTDNIVLHGVLL